MRLQRIYSSKLYVTSTRKDRIHAAMQDPINMELVQQLSEYLDDDSLQELKQVEKKISEEKSAEAKNSESSNNASNDNSFSSKGSNGSFTPPAFSGSPADDFGEDELADIDIPEEGEESSDSAEAPEEAIESVTQEGKKITATSLIWTTVEDVSGECDTIQGTLNAREDTKGVTRLQVTENELWIYYNDESNLNDKMIDVISVLNSTGYTYLKFNRLARSNNAIVFDINLNTSEDIKSVNEISEEK